MSQRSIEEIRTIVRTAGLFFHVVCYTYRCQAWVLERPFEEYRITSKQLMFAGGEFRGSQKAAANQAFDHWVEHGLDQIA